MELAEGAVDAHFVEREGVDHGLVAAALGFGDAGAEFALAEFEVAVVK